MKNLKYCVMAFLAIVASVAVAYDPMETMFMPMPGMDYSGFLSTDPAVISAAAAHNASQVPEMDFSQLPRGIHGLKPVGYSNDGRPIFNDMPVYSEVKGAFIAPVYIPGPDPLLPSLPVWVEFPAKGKKRKAVIAQIAKEFQEAHVRQIAYSISPEAQAKRIESEKARNEAWAKEKAIADAEHQRQMDLKDRLYYHMNDNQLQHFREGWKPLVPRSNDHYGTPDLMVNPRDGNVYRVY